MEKYKCEICNKKHAVYYSSKGGIPRNVLDMRINEETNRIEELSENLHIIDKKDVIVKGNITIETSFTEYPITYEAWIEIPIKEYVSQVEEANGKPNLELFGKIASELPFYQDFVGLDAKLIIGEESGLGEIKALTDSKLKEDQQKPIKERRVTKMMELIHHPELYKEKTTFNKSFEERFKEIVKIARIEFTTNGKCFLINISNLKEVLFQLISSELLSCESQGEIGIHLSNDEANENYDLVKNRMPHICETYMFEKIILDEIETYQKNYQFNDESLFNEVKQIIESIYDENIEEIEIEIDEM